MEKNNLKNFYFIKTDRSYFESFISIRENTIGGSSFYNFYNLEGKNHFFIGLKHLEKLCLIIRKIYQRKDFSILNLKV